jgi:hypothetical protein
MTISAVSPKTGGGLSVASRHARPFEPTGIGPLYPRFARFLQRIAGKRQSDALSLITKERASVQADASTDALAYQLTLSVLADYITFGNYPLVINGRCFLVPVLQSTDIPAERRRILAQRLFCIARDRALAERGQLRWTDAVIEALADERYHAGPAIEAMRWGPPQFRLLEARSSARRLDTRGIWRAVRTTWSMGVESSAPGREVAFVGVDERFPDIPLGIVQFRNVVPEIIARDRWLGITSAVGPEGEPLGYLRYLTGSDARDRLDGTQGVLATLLAHVNREGLPDSITCDSDPRKLTNLAASQRSGFNELRKQADRGARERLLIVKRAETAADLIRGLNAVKTAIAAKSSLDAFSGNPDLLRDLNAGLRKIWHYHMGFVAIEMSICGAAPPFGPMRLGKLMAMAAASEDLLDAWGRNRSLGEIAAETYLPSVREYVPNPGPLVVFTSGLYAGHSAQYNRLQAGAERWRKIGETVGYGSFHVSFETSRIASQYNAAVDGYRHITRTFGEGASPRFREVSRGIARLGLPDLLRHEMPRPLYALQLVRDPQAILLGWKTGDPAESAGQPLNVLAKAWWERWFAPQGDRLCALSAETPNLRETLARIHRSAAVDVADGLGLQRNSAS